MVPVEAVAGKMMSDQAELTAIVTVFHDQTETIEKERLYDELRRASDQLEAKVQAATAELEHQNTLLRNQAIALEQASAAKSQFLANISHEFRTPLNAILGYTSMLLNGAYGDVLDTHRRIVSRVDANSRHLLALISDILDISRIEAGRMPLQLSTFQIDDLVRQVTEELDAMIPRSPVGVEFVTAPRVPPIRSDRQKVKQILVNLLTQRAEVHARGIDPRDDGLRSRGRHAHHRSARHRDRHRPADQQRIFEDFQQVDSSPTRSHGGTGLGLSICRRFADMLGGRIALREHARAGIDVHSELADEGAGGTARHSRRGTAARALPDDVRSAGAPSTATHGEKTISEEGDEVRPKGRREAGAQGVSQSGC